MRLDLATAATAKATRWKNAKWTWAQLVSRLAAPVAIAETCEQYAALPAVERAKRKDIGGYVGGYLREGRRKAAHVKHRQVVALDLDRAEAGADVVGLAEGAMRGSAYVLHSTLSHTPASPRYRLVFPLSRPVSPDEYAALSRLVADRMGVELFDPSTFQAERLMFWPSICSDATYVFNEAIADEPQDADATLDEYEDWRDVSAWPTASGAPVEAKRAGKQQDPTTKAGLIGAFCRAYDIEKALAEFLPDQYAPHSESRYTYAGGTAAGGLTIYGGKWAYSHHATDPASEKLCNAFDLVRLHKFGENGNSQGDMLDFAKQDERTRLQLAREAFGEADDDAEGEDGGEAAAGPQNLDWAKDLDMNKKGEYLSSAANLKLIFQHDPALKGAFARNLFDSRNYVLRDLPWREVERAPAPLANVDYAGVRSYLECTYGIANVGKVDDAFAITLQNNAYDPLNEYLEALQWDGAKRIDRLLIKYLGVEDTAYARNAMRVMLVGAVARALRPGVKFDLVLTLVGEREGEGKSTFLGKLGAGFYSDSFHTVEGKEAFEQLRGAWLIEIAELSGFGKSQAEKVKHFITKRVDDYRPPYARDPEPFPRRCVFFATTNRYNFLKDPTGNRRFLPVVCRPEAAELHPAADGSLGEEEVGQIWAEAVALWKSGAKTYLEKDKAAEAREVQAAHLQIDDRASMVERFLEAKLPTNWDEFDAERRKAFLASEMLADVVGTDDRQYVCAAEIYVECFGFDRARMTFRDSHEIADIMRNMEGWKRVGRHSFALYGQQRAWKREG